MCQLSHLCKTPVPGVLVKITFCKALRRIKIKYFPCGCTDVHVEESWASQHKCYHELLQHCNHVLQKGPKPVFKEKNERLLGILFSQHLGHCFWELVLCRTLQDDLRILLTPFSYIKVGLGKLKKKKDWDDKMQRENIRQGL